MSEINFPIYFMDKDPEETGLPDDDICYLVGKKGIFIKKKLGIIESIAPVKNISFLHDVSPDAVMHINPIKVEQCANVLTFFRAVYNFHKSEAIVLLFYNQETGDFVIKPPHQKVRGASCDYTRGSVKVDGYDLIGTIHSHANFSAFHSGTDQGDEKTFDGLHITFGHVASDQFSISCSIVVNGFRIIVDPSEYLEGVKKVKYQTNTHNYNYKVWDVKTKQMVEKKPKLKYETRYELEIASSKMVYDKNWLKKVELKKWESTYGVGKHWDYRNPFGGRRQIPMFDPFTGVYEAAAHSPYNVGKSSNVKPLDFPKHDDEDFNPCADCVFKEYKIEWAIDQYTEEVDDDDDDLLDDNYTPMENDEGTGLWLEGEEITLEEDGNYHHPTYGIIDLRDYTEDLTTNPDLDEITRMVEEEYESDEILVHSSDAPRHGQRIPSPDEIPESLIDKPRRWARSFIHRRFREKK